jgi:hypothetical protein
LQGSRLALPTSSTRKVVSTNENSATNQGIKPWSVALFLFLAFSAGGPRASDETEIHLLALEVVNCQERYEYKEN